jgi:NADPH:quinone reductase-like Zn-dependent oxidoreductase
MDVAGVIVDLDSERNDLKIGDKVCYHGNLARPGGYAE